MKSDGAWERCYCLTINDDRENGSYFESCKVVVKENIIYAYDDTDGKMTYYPIKESEFFLNKRIGSSDELYHFVRNDKWGLFLFETGEIVVEPVWDFIGNLVIEGRNSNWCWQNKATKIYDKSIRTRDVNFQSDLMQHVYHFHVARKLETGEEKKDLCKRFLFDELGHLNFNDYEKYLESPNLCGAVHGVLCSTGEVLVPLEYDALREISVRDDKYAFVVKKDQKMRVLTGGASTDEYDDIKIIGQFAEGKFMRFNMFFREHAFNSVVIMFVMRNEKFGMLSFTDEFLRIKEIIPPYYDSIEMVGFGSLTYFKVKSAGREGMICLNENIVIPVKWEKMIPVNLSSEEKKTEFGWNRNANGMICIESPSNAEKLVAKDPKERIRFSIFNSKFDLVTPENLDGFAAIKSSFRKNEKVSYIVRKQEHYGIIMGNDFFSESKIDMNLSFLEAVSKIRNLQKIEYVENIINYIKINYKTINKYVKQNQKIIAIKKPKDFITKKEVLESVSEIEVMLKDLRAFRMAVWARNITSLIEDEKHDEMLVIIGDLLEWLQSLKKNPELIYESSLMIENEKEEAVQSFQNLISDDLINAPPILKYKIF